VGAFERRKVVLDPRMRDDVVVLRHHDQNVAFECHAGRQSPVLARSYSAPAVVGQTVFRSGAGGVDHRPRLLSDNDSSYISVDLASWLKGKGMTHVRGAPSHPITQGKIECWHQTFKNRILLENCTLPGDPEAQIEALSRSTITGAITRASTSSPRPTFTSDVMRPF
jgi:transposase InsO family protein